MGHVSPGRFRIVALCCLLASMAVSARDVTEEDLRSAGDAVATETQRYVIDANAWRNMMPIVNSPGVITRRTGLHVQVTLRVARGGDLPGGIRFRRLWLLTGGRNWEANLKTVGSEITPTSVTIRNAPPLPAESRVDVVLLFEDAAGEYLIAKREVVVKEVH